MWGLQFLKNYGWQVNKRLIAWLATINIFYKEYFFKKKSENSVFIDMKNLFNYLLPSQLEYSTRQNKQR